MSKTSYGKHGGADRIKEETMKAEKKIDAYVVSLDETNNYNIDSRESGCWEWRGSDLDALSLLSSALVEATIK